MSPVTCVVITDPDPEGQLAWLIDWQRGQLGAGPVNSIISVPKVVPGWQVLKVTAVAPAGDRQ